MSAEFKLICDVSAADEVTASRTDDDTGICFTAKFGNRQEGGSVFVKPAEARAFAHFILSLTE